MKMKFSQDLRSQHPQRSLFTRNQITQFNYVRYHCYWCIRKYPQLWRFSSTHQGACRKGHQSHSQEMNKSEEYPTHRWCGWDHREYPRDQVTRPQNRIREKSRLNYFLLPMSWFLVDSIGSNLVYFSRFETICCECSTEATTRIKTNSILTKSQSLRCPMSIEYGFLSCVIFIPWSTIMGTNECRYLEWCLESMIRMESTMYNDTIITLNNMRKWENPILVWSKNLLK